MTEPHYIHMRTTSEYAEWSKKAFHRFLSALSQDDWEDFLTDVVCENTRAYQIIPERQDGNIVPSVAILLRELPAGLIAERPARALANILREMSSSGKPTDSDAIRCILCAIRLAGSLPTQDVIDALVSLVVTTRTPEPIRGLAASTLAIPSFAQQLHATFWLTLDLHSAPVLLPAVMLALGNTNARKALQIASGLEAMSDTVNLEYPLRMTIRSLRYQHQHHEEILDDTIQEAPSWLRRQMLSVLRLPEFANLSDPHRQIARDWAKSVGCDALKEMLSSDADNGEHLEFRCVLGKYLLTGIGIAEQVGHAALAASAAKYRKATYSAGVTHYAFAPPWQIELFRSMHLRIMDVASEIGCGRPQLRQMSPFEDNFQTMSRANDTTLHKYFLAEPWFNDRAVRANNREVVQFGVVKELVAIADVSTAYSMVGCDPQTTDVFSPESTLTPLAFKAFLRNCQNMQLTVCTPRNHASDNVVIGSPGAIEFPRGLTARRDTVGELAAFINEDMQHGVVLCDVGVAYQLLALLNEPTSPYHKARAARGFRVYYPRPLPVGFAYSRHPLWNWCGGLIRECLDAVVRNAVGDVQESLQVTSELLHVLRIDCDWLTVDKAERTTHEYTT